jgi:hypothetical protein
VEDSNTKPKLTIWTKKELDRMRTYIIYHHIKYPGTLYKAEATPEKMEILKQYNGITFAIDRIVTE